MQVQYCTFYPAMQNVNTIIKVFQTHPWNSQTISCKEKENDKKFCNTAGTSKQD
jgi:hypothetical protein